MTVNRENPPAEHLGLLYRVSRALLQEGEYGDTAFRALDTLIEGLGADRGFVVVREAGEFRATAARNFRSEALSRAEEAVSRSIAQSVMESGRAVLIGDASITEPYSRQPSIQQLSLPAEEDNTRKLRRLRMKFKNASFALAVLFCVSTASAQVTGSGTSHAIPIWTGTTTLGNSAIVSAGGNVAIGTISPNGKLTVVSTSATANAISGNANDTPRVCVWPVRDHCQQHELCLCYLR